jgi:hypothetical protein
MKAYIINPSFQTFGQDDERTTAAIELIAEIVLGCLRRGGDSFHYSVVWANPGEEPGRVWNEDVAVPHVAQLDTAEALRGWLRRSLDPNTAGSGVVRSIATCRTVTFGYDGQALLLLRHEDSPPTSPDPSLAVVAERPDLLRDSDWFDGWIRGEPEIANNC